MKKKVIIICFLIIALCVLFLEVLNISIGYYGYGYDGARMFSLTKQERSEERRVERVFLP